MVRLEASALMALMAFLRDFNSTMVRLEVLTSIYCEGLSINFNSTMVRLEGNSTAHGFPARSISIPLWYD